LAPFYLTIVDFNNNSGQVIEKDNCGGSECFKSLKLGKDYEWYYL